MRNSITAPVTVLSALAALSSPRALHAQAETATLSSGYSEALLSKELVGTMDLASARFKEDSSKLLSASDRGSNAVSGSSLSRLVNDVQRQLFAGLERREFSAMRDYVAYRFPPAPPPNMVDPLTGSPALSKTAANHYIESVSAFLTRLRRPRPLSMNVIVRTEPSEADVQLKTTAVILPSARTNTTLRNVYRGMYSVTVDKPSYKGIQTLLDLVDDESPEFHCILAPELTTGQSSCRRK